MLCRTAVAAAEFGGAVVSGQQSERCERRGGCVDDVSACGVVTDDVCIMCGACARWLCRSGQSVVAGEAALAKRVEPRVL